MKILGRNIDLNLTKTIKKKHKMTAIVNGFSIFKIPLLAFCTPQVVEISEKKTIARIRLDWRTGNHLGVMYFGALSIGAELSIALKAIEKIDESKQRIDFTFKDFKAEFLKRADDHVLFICEEADQVTALIESAKISGDRFEKTFNGFAALESAPAIPIVKHSLTLSVKNRSIQSTTKS